ncbi:MAG: crotonase/enoyl-CoA hydratase family protein [Myxococcota bacterium]
MAVQYTTDGRIAVVTLDRPARKNAVDRPTAEALANAFRRFDADDDADVAILTGAGNTFCAGADLKAMTEGEANRVTPDGDGPMGPTRMRLSKPVIAAIEGHAVAGGLELALWCDLRVAAADATLGVFCRRWGVPLIDGGTVRLPRLIGRSAALDLILTGRPVSAPEALRLSLINRMADPGQALTVALELARQLSSLPQRCLREDRMSVYETEAMPETEGMQRELAGGLRTLTDPAFLAGVAGFAARER